jgi:hypothetical protein
MPDDISTVDFGCVAFWSCLHTVLLCGSTAAAAAAGMLNLTATAAATHLLRWGPRQPSYADHHSSWRTKRISCCASNDVNNSLNAEGSVAASGCQHGTTYTKCDSEQHQSSAREMNVWLF